MSLQLLVSAIGIILIAGFVLLYIKIRNVHLTMYRMNNVVEKNISDTFLQIEAMIGLYYELRPQDGLPGTRGWAGSPDFLRHITHVVKDRKPNIILECSSGVSTIVLARAVQLRGVGHVFSLEHDPVFAKKTRANLVEHGLQNFATVIDAPLVKHTFDGSEWLWYSTENLPENVDFLVIDGPPMSIQRLARFPAIPLLYSRLSCGAKVMLDDADRPDEIEVMKIWESTFALERESFYYAEKGIGVFNKSQCIGTLNRE